MPTIGVSVAVPEPWGRQLQEYRIGLGDPQATQIPTHITLVPPYEIADAELTGVIEHLSAAAAAMRPYRMHLRGTGTFRPVSPVVFVVVVEGISACEQLAAHVRTGPLAADLRFPYHPHVTIAHDLDEASLDRAFDELAGFECVFEVDSFALYEHDPATGWRPTKEFPLGG